MTEASRTSRTTSETMQRQQQGSGEDPLPRHRSAPPESAAPPCTGSRPEVRWLAISSSSALRRTNRSLRSRSASSVNTNRMSPTRYRTSNALRPEPTVLHLVGPDRERGDRCGECLVRFQRVQRATRLPVAPAAIATTIVSPRAREIPRINAATIPEIAAGTHDTERDGPTASTDPVGRLPEGTRHRVHRVLGHGGDEGIVSNPTPIPAANIVKEFVAPKSALHDDRVDDGEREEADHHARDAGERLEDRLQASAARAGARTRRGRSRRPEPERSRRPASRPP